MLKDKYHLTFHWLPQGYSPKNYHHTMAYPDLL